MSYKVGVKSRFSAAHSLREYEGNCENLHGHNWYVEVACQADKLDRIGLVIDFRILKKTLKETLDILDHRLLNDLEPFKTVNPSSENIAKFIFNELLKKLPAEPKVDILSVRVWENEDCWAEYSDSKK